MSNPVEFAVEINVPEQGRWADLGENRHTC